MAKDRHLKDWHLEEAARLLRMATSEADLLRQDPLPRGRRAPATAARRRAVVLAASRKLIAWLGYPGVAGEPGEPDEAEDFHDCWGE